MWKSRIELASAIARVAIWAIVTLWCFTPLIWMLFLGATGPRADAPPPMFRPNPVDQNFMMRLMASAFLMGAFVYSIWAAAGCVMGWGASQAIGAVARIASIALVDRAATVPSIED